MHTWQGGGLPNTNSRDGCAWDASMQPQEDAQAGSSLMRGSEGPSQRQLEALQAGPCQLHLRGSQAPQRP